MATVRVDDVPPSRAAWRNAIDGRALALALDPRAEACSHLAARFVGVRQRPHTCSHPLMQAVHMAFSTHAAGRHGGGAARAARRGRRAWEYLGARLPMVMRAGLLGVCVTSEGALRPEVGWLIAGR